MTRKTKREALLAELPKLQDKLRKENLKSTPDGNIIAGLVESIRDAEVRLASDDPDLEKPYGFNFSAV